MRRFFEREKGNDGYRRGDEHGRESGLRVVEYGPCGRG